MPTISLIGILKAEFRGERGTGNSVVAWQALNVALKLSCGISSLAHPVQASSLHHKNYIFALFEPCHANNYNQANFSSGLLAVYQRGCGTSDDKCQYYRLS